MSFVDENSVLVGAEGDIVNINSDLSFRYLKARFDLKLVKEIRKTFILVEEIVLLSEKLLT